MLLTAFILILSAAFFWAGFKAAPHPLQYKSQAGFVLTVALALFTGYFAWRESRTLAELTELIEPVPEITDVSYVPTSGEVAALSQVISAAPVSTQERPAEYWLVTTALASDSVLAFYRGAALRGGWVVHTDEPPWLILSRPSGQLVLFVSDESPRPGSKVLHSFSPSR